jgi:hypothetical protein
VNIKILQNEKPEPNVFSYTPTQKDCKYCVVADSFGYVSPKVEKTELNF